MVREIVPDHSGTLWCLGPPASFLFLFVFCCFWTWKPTVHMQCPGQLTNPEHSTYWLTPDVHSVLFLSNRCKVINQISRRLHSTAGYLSHLAQSIFPTLASQLKLLNFNYWIPAIIFIGFQTGGILIVLVRVWSFWISSLNGDSLQGFI